MSEIAIIIKKSSLHKKLGNFVKCTQGAVKNEIILRFEHGSVLQSYSSLVAARCEGGTLPLPQT